MDEYNSTMAKRTNDAMKVFSLEVYDHIKTKYGIETHPDILFHVGTDKSVINHRNPKFDDNYTDGGCLKTYVRGVGKKHKYCGKALKSNPWYCNACYSKPTKQMSLDINALNNSDITVSEIVERNRINRMGDMMITINKQRNSSGSKIQLCRNAGLYSEPYTYIVDYRDTFIDINTRNVYGVSIGDNRLYFIGVDIDCALSRDVSYSTINDVKNFNDVDILIDDSINILEC